MPNIYINKSNHYNSPKFTDDQKKLLSKYFTNLDRPVYAFTSNVPSEVAGALISRFSRSNVSPRELFFTEFLNNPDLGLLDENATIVASDPDNAAKERAGKFFRQVLAKYGDESVAEITGVHVIVEKASLIVIKVIESMRRMAFIEQSTRYIDLSQKVNGNYEYFRDTELMNYIGTEYEKYSNNLYDKYNEWFELVKEHVEKNNPMLPEDTEVGYKQAIHSRTCDILRELLPISLRATVGVYGYGRDWSDLINIMLAHDFEEVREVGKMILQEVSVIIPNIMDRTSGPHGQMTQKFLTERNYLIAKTINSSQLISQKKLQYPNKNIISTKILDITSSPIEKIAAGVAYPMLSSEYNHLLEYYKFNKPKALELLNDLTKLRNSRFDKVPDGFENIRMKVEFTAPWSCWKDIQRHRRLTEIHNLYFINYGFYMAPEIVKLGIDKEYMSVMKSTLEFIETISEKYPQLKETISYLVPHGANFRWIMDMDFAEAIYMMELRSIASGHMTYRGLMHSFYYELKKISPELSDLVKFIDLDQYYLGRRQSYNKVVEKGASLE